MAEQNLGRVRFVPRGNWNSSTTYRFFDLVSHDGATFVYIGAAASSGGSAPSPTHSNWQRIAARGQAGDDGDDGAAPAHQWSSTKLCFKTPNGTWGSYTDLKGAKGDDGDDGDDGDAPEHQWSGTQLRFRNPNGSWGSYVDLEGPQGPAGDDGGGTQPCACGQGK